ncbi:glycosyltransferase family 4 protein [bacterium]|nr:glycosyltransferase family 4 protein [bacterium]
MYTVKTLKVGINARILDTQQLRGWSRYTVELVRGLLKKNIQVVLFSDKPINTSFFAQQKPTVILQKGINYFDWEQRVLPLLAQNEKVDILHCPTNYGLPYFCKTKKILTLHDAIEKAFYDSRKTLLKRWSFEERKMRLYHRLSQIAADKIITVSHHAKNDLMKHYGIAEKKIAVIYEAAEDRFSSINVKSIEELKKKYSHFIEDSLFYVGGLEDRKNIDTLVQAYRKSIQKKHLLVAGSNKQYQSTEKIHFMGYVEEEDLPSLYYHCYAFIYPSLYEGFGLQAVEAMKMKKAVIASENTSLREIIDNDDCLFDPYNEASITQKINWIFDEKIAKDIEIKSYERSKIFSWDKCVEQTIQIYKEVCL